MNEQNPYQSPAAFPPPLPVDKRPWNGWWTLLWAVGLFFLWQIVVTVGIVIAGIKKGIFEDIDELDSNLEALMFDGDVIGLVTFATLFFICPVCWLIGQVRPGFSGLEYLGSERVKWWQWIFWGGLTVAMAYLFGLVAPSMGVEDPDDSMVAMAKTTTVPLYLYLGVGIGAPLIEEFVFRGVLWRGCRNSRLGLPGTLIVTSFCWTILHVQYPVPILSFLFVLGLILGYAREKTGNVWVPVFMHAVNNALATLEILSLR